MAANLSLSLRVRARVFSLSPKSLSSLGAAGVSFVVQAEPQKTDQRLLGVSITGFWAHTHTLGSP